MKNIKNILFIALFFTSISIFSQEKTESIRLNVTVKNSKSEPIPGAIILIDNSKQDITTNENGNFKIILKKALKEIAAFSPLIGIKKIKYLGENNIEIIISSENNDISLIKDDTNYKNDNTIQYRNIYDYLRGKVPGVNIDSENRIVIRGYNTVLGGNRSPLFILNDNQVEQDIFSNIVPTDIKSIKILKGTETSSYGSRGANGVIIVQTL